MRLTTLTWLIVTVWLVSFLFCLVIPVYLKPDIPENFFPLVKQVFEAFAPGLSTMLACIFAKRHAPPRTTSSEAMSMLPRDLVALIATALYVGLFDIAMGDFALDRANAAETIELFQQYRPLISFLVVGVFAFYFSAPITEGE